MRAVTCLSLAALFSGVALSQSAAPQPTFEVADVHVSAKMRYPFMRGGPARGGRYEIHNATMVDLISNAYGVDAEKVLGGPNWLERDRFDVTAKVPASSTPEEQKAMLQALLAERFKLVAHKDTQQMPAFALKSLKKPSLKASDGSGETGCKFTMPAPPPPAPPSAGSAPVIFVPTFTYTCQNITMEAFAAQMRTMVMAEQTFDGRSVVDETELKGTYDFTLKYSMRGIPMQVAGETVTLMDAVEKQLGLKLELVKLPMPVMIVDSVSEKPTENSPDVAEKLKMPTSPTEFEVAEIKPTDPETRGMRFNIQPGGRVTLTGVNLKFLIEQAWNVSDDMLVGAPKWMEDERFDIIAKAPSSAGSQVDIEVVWLMVRSLLADRFKLVTHKEEKVVPAYTLLAAKPKMKKADPASRTKFKEGAANADGKDPRNANPMMSRLVTCQNMTMAQFAEELQNIAPGYIHSPVLDATGLDGSYDFTLNFSPAGLAQIGMGRGGGPAGGGVAEASDPSGALTLPEAIEKQLGLKLEQQKRPVSVLVIDHADQKPSDN